MRVALLASGRSYHATRWANGLTKRGIKIGFFTIHPVVHALNENIEVFAIGNGRKADYVICAKRIRAALKSWAPELIHCHYATGYGLLGKLSGYEPRIVSIYGSDAFDFPKKSIFHRKLLRYIISGSSVILSTSQIMANELKIMYPKLAMPTVTPFGVDLNKFYPANRVVAMRNVFNIGIVKKLERIYGVDVLVGALAILIQNRPEIKWNLNIVGDGSQLLLLKDQVIKLGIQERVSFLGAIENRKVPEFLRSQDVFVVPSREESFGVAAVEAQACGLPVVASNVGGLPEVVSDNKTGLIVPKEDKLALAQAIEKICLNEELRYKYSMGARERAVRRFDWSKNLDQMIDIYTRISERTK